MQLALATSLTPAVSASRVEASGEATMKLDPNTVLKALNRQHPRLVLTDKRLNELKKLAESDSVLAGYVDAVLSSADRVCEQPGIGAAVGGLGGGNLHRRVVLEAYTLGLAWRWTGRDAYADRLKEDLLAVCAMPDWQPEVFLVTAETCHGVAIGYDWLYNWLDRQSRDAIASAILAKGVQAGLHEHRAGTNWTRRIYNWNNVCNGGLTVGALAIADLNPSEACQLLDLALAGLPKALAAYEPDGVWPEGITYWDYATRYTVYALSALETALEADLGLSDRKGLEETALFPAYVTGPTGMVFDFADAHPRPRGSAPYLYWLAKRYGRAEFVDVENRNVADGGATAWHVAWYWTPDQPRQFRGRLDKLLGGIVEIAVFRGSWRDPDALFACLKSGHNRTGHAHLDLGSFVLDALGQRWATDLGTDNYDLPGYFDKFDNDGQRWTYFRTSSRGHNVPMLDNMNQEVVSGARMAAFKGDVDRPFAVVDLTPVYKSKAAKVVRGLSIVGGRRAVLVQDEIQLKGPCQVSWGMTTHAEIKTGPLLAGSGKQAGAGQAGPARAVLTQQGRQLAATILAPAGAEFSVESAEMQAPQAENKGVRRLMIRLPDQDGSVLLAVLLAPCWADGGEVAPPAVKPISDW